MSAAAAPGRWRCPWRGDIGGATAYPHASHSPRFPRAQWAVVGVSIPDITATLGVTPAAVRLAPKPGTERTATGDDRTGG
ncbi:MAG: hypothetical protein ACRDTH_21700 [Pseudonocardiaceae bacterium]